ncbi:MAG: ADP-ribosylglycohydrolase family protein [Spirochaetes bacterium]|nr:ADP-ribosylglycohydrolase family protein [Spirochaetota bacterium]
MPIPRNYLEKLYAGVLGKCIGIRIGAPVEPTVWTYERIRKTYGEISSYVRDYRLFAADDDFNGPAFFIRALVDYGKDGDITAADIGKAFLNYTREEKGFHWWGGYGRSTEHTAYLNLASGMEAPESGSMATNGAAIAEQIGGQIFVDTWGLVFPADVGKAAYYGGMAASVSHDGNGLYGGRFIAAAISRAFETDDVAAILDAAQSVIPADSEYARVVRAVIEFHRGNPSDFRACMDYLTAGFGYDRYPGVCHIIPNAGVCILSLLYGEGDLSRTVEIATMCGWDTDCNAGNVGTIIGVAGGLEGVADRYRLPMNDFFACSSIAGSLNIVDLPTFSKQMALLGLRFNHESGTETEAEKSDRAGLEAYLEASTGYRELHFDFTLSGSTHGFRTDSNALTLKNVRLESGGALEILVDRLPRGSGSGVFFKPFYRREDFDDERYSPAFSPLVHPGQTMKMRVNCERWGGSPLAVIPYARETHGKRILEGAAFELAPGIWTDIEYVLPDTDGASIDEIGIKVEVLTDERCLGKIFIKDFSVTGKARYAVDFAKQRAEFATITPGVANRGFWNLEGDSLLGMSVGRAEFYAGNYYSRDIRFSTTVTPLAGDGHGILFRAKGAMMGYAVVLASPGRIAFLRNDHGLAVVEEKPFAWHAGGTYVLAVEAVGQRLRVSAGGSAIFDIVDGSFGNGMYGFCRTRRGRCLFGRIEVEELSEGR